MTQTIEVDLGKILERIEQNLNKHIETTNENLTKILVNQARLEGEVKVLQVEVQNVKKDVEELKTEIKESRNSNKWVIGLIITLGVGVLTVILRVFDLLPNPQ